MFIVADLVSLIHEIWKKSDKNDKIRVTTTADTDRRRPFCRPSWLFFFGHNTYSNLSESLMDAVHI